MAYTQTRQLCLCILYEIFSTNLTVNDCMTYLLIYAWLYISLFAHCDIDCIYYYWMRIWRSFESNVSLWVKGCEVTFHRDQVSYCYVWKWTLKKLPLFWLIYMFVYKMRLFMNDVLFIMLTQIIDND